MQDPRSVERLRSGDVATLKRIFKANYAKLYPMAFRLTKDRTAASDVIRGAFANLWSERAHIDVFEPLDTRLVKDTFSEAMSYRAEHGVTGFALTTDDRISQNGSARALDAISEEDRLKYVLFAVDGYSFRELARAFDQPVDEIQLAVGRSLTQLKESPDSR